MNKKAIKSVTMLLMTSLLKNNEKIYINVNGRPTFPGRAAPNAQL